MSNPKHFPCNQPAAGQILQIFRQLKKSSYFSVLGVACCREARKRTNSTCIQLHNTSTLRPFGGLLFACHQVLVLMVQKVLYYFNCLLVLFKCLYHI